MTNKNNYTCKAKKSYKCNVCKNIINIGEKYHRLNKNYGNVQHICLNCWSKNRQNVKKIFDENGELIDEFKFVGDLISTEIDGQCCEYRWDYEEERYRFWSEDDLIREEISYDSEF